MRPREVKGTTASRKLRRGGQVPAVVYGAGKKNQRIAARLERN